MKKACISYTTDTGYLFPSLLSAMQARKNSDITTADVALCYVGDKSLKSEMIESVCIENNILFYNVTYEAINDLHVMYARLFLDTILGSNYEKIIYIDGDTQITSHLTSLVDALLPTGMILAARDPMTLTIERGNKAGLEYKSYLESIGIHSSKTINYFNSGVMVFNVKDWQNIRQDCLDLRRKNNRDYNFPDQDILNLSAGDRNLTMSFKWNFPIYFLNHPGIEDIINPHIYHFMSNPRPWQGAFWPWGKEYSDQYHNLVLKYPQLKMLAVEIPSLVKYKYKFQQYYKYVSENLNWNKEQFKSYVQNIEDKAFI